MSKGQSQESKDQVQVQPSAGTTAPVSEALTPRTNPAVVLQRVMAAPPPEVNPGDLLTLQRAVGNQRVRRMLLRKNRTFIAREMGVSAAIQHGDPRAGAVARQLIPAAEARARGATHTWSPLPEALRTRFEGMAADRSQRAALLQQMWSAIPGSRTYGSRVTVELTEHLGVVNGQRVARVGMGQGVTLAYVNATPQCAGLQGDEHISQHQAHHQAGPAAEIHAIIQVNPNIFHTAANEAVSNLYSLLMHEYIHVEQSIARGVHPGVRFVAAGRREFLSEQGLPPAERQAVEGLDEIEALCAEIENRVSTGLEVSFSMRNTIDYLWDAYENYHDALSDPATQIDRRIAGRVYRDLQDGTQALFNYLNSPAAQWLTPSLRNDARRPPQGYVSAKIFPYRR
jgi:hypothetical protein